MTSENIHYISHICISVLFIVLLYLVTCTLILTMADNVEEKEHQEKPAPLKKMESDAMRQSDKSSSGKKSKLKSVEEELFPTTLEGFKYKFNDEGQLRHIETGEPFEFMVREDMKYNQKNYEALGEVITESVFELLESKGNLKKHYIPIDAKKGSAQSFIYLSEDALSNPDKLLILIHGSGVVRAGQWTRKLIINEDLDHGTQLPYIKKGMEEGYGIIVLNSNYNSAIVNGSPKKIKENTNPEEHGIYVWKHFVKQAKAKHIAIVAHSYGGHVTSTLADKFKTDFENRVFAIGFTDSVHMAAGTSVGKCFEKKAINWVTSDKPRDTPMPSFRKHDAKRLSAGHEKHEWTSWASFESVFTFINDMYPGNAKAKGSVDSSIASENNVIDDNESNKKPRIDGGDSKMVENVGDKENVGDGENVDDGENVSGVDENHGDAEKVGVENVGNGENNGDAEKVGEENVGNKEKIVQEPMETSAGQNDNKKDENTEL